MTEEERKALLMMLTPEELIGYANSGTQEPFIDEGRIRLFSQGGEVAAAAQEIYAYIDSGADPVTAAQEFLSGLYPEKYPNMPADQVQDIVDTVAKTGYGMAKSRASMPTGADQLDKLGLGSLAPLLQYTQNKSAGNYTSPTGMQDTYKSILGRNVSEADRLKNLLFEESKSSKKKDLSNKAKAGAAGTAVGLGVGTLPLLAAGAAGTGIGVPVAAGLMGLSLLAGAAGGLGFGNKKSGPATNEYGYTQKEFEAGRTKKLKGIDAKNARALAALEAEQKKAMARQQLYQDTYDTELAKYKVPSEFDIRKSLMLKALND
jgi:hypothetical protein